MDLMGDGDGDDLMRRNTQISKGDRRGTDRGGAVVGEDVMSKQGGRYRVSDVDGRPWHSSLTRPVGYVSIVQRFQLDAEFCNSNHS